jgi:hypothetical protein
MAAKNGSVLRHTDSHNNEKPIAGGFVQVFFIATLHQAKTKNASQPAGDDEELNSYLPVAWIKRSQHCAAKWQFDFPFLISVRWGLVDWVLSKPVAVSGYSKDVRFAGELWKMPDNVVHFNDNSGTYLPAPAATFAALDLAHAMFPGLTIEAHPRAG